MKTRLKVGVLNPSPNSAPNQAFCGISFFTCSFWELLLAWWGLTPSQLPALHFSGDTGRRALLTA